MVIDHTPTHFQPKACSTGTGTLPRHLAPGNNSLKCFDMPGKCLPRLTYIPGSGGLQLQVSNKLAIASELNVS